MNAKRGWIGVDLDGTLAEYHGWVHPTVIGPPIPAMLDRVKQWLVDGHEVRIFTARMFPGPYEAEHPGEVEAAIRAWSLEHVGQELMPTCIKDFGMTVLYDDRAVTVEQNTGRMLAPEQPRFTP